MTRSAAGPRTAWAVAATTFLLAVVAGVLVVDSPHPPGLFAKYLRAAALTSEALEAQGRMADYSPLYLTLCRLLLPLGPHAILWTQCLLNAVACGCVAWFASRAAGPRWGLLGGLLAAGYRPMLVHAGLHEPETLLLTCLALAVVLGACARERIAEGGLGRERPAAIAWALSASVACSLAALARPQWILLLPAWAAWLSLAATARRDAARAAGLILAGGALVLLPAWAIGFTASGSSTVMNPGPVLYEGNGPEVTGLIRHAPDLVKRLERENRGSLADYGHVAYRRLAAHALGREVEAGASNRYWTALTLEGLKARPLLGARRLLHKLSMAVSPHEAHDLVVGEHLDRRARRRIPWGFGVLLAALPAVAFLDRSRLALLFGPGCIAAVAVLVQVVFYASSRQRLPLALALLFLVPIAAAEIARGRLRAGVSGRAVVALGLVLALAVTLGTAGTAARNAAAWSAAVGPPTAGAGEHVAAWFDGRAWAPGTESQTRRLHAAARAVRSAPESDLPPILQWLEELDRQDPDLTVDDTLVAVPSYWSARGLLRLGRREEAVRAVARAREVRPQSTAIAALALALAGPSGEGGARWRPPGIDPASADWALAEAWALCGRPEAARALVRPLLASFPELGPGGREDEPARRDP